MQPTGEFTHARSQRVRRFDMTEGEAERCLHVDTEESNVVIVDEAMRDAYREFRVPVFGRRHARRLWAMHAVTCAFRVKYLALLANRIPLLSWILNGAARRE